MKEKTRHYGLTRLIKKQQTSIVSETSNEHIKTNAIVGIQTMDVGFANGLFFYVSASYF